MGSKSWNLPALVFLAVALAGTIGVVEGIRCYQCGTYIITSVTPCQNLTNAHLQECPHDNTHCSKYSGPAINVYGCEKECVERVQNSFEIHCCGEDKCNDGYSVTQSAIPLWLLSGPTLALAVARGNLHFQNPFF